MKSNLPLYIGLRYALSQRKEGFLSFISVFSFCAMALGVMTLIVVLSVMNGFDREIKQRLLNIIPHISIKHDSNISPQKFDQLSKQLSINNDRVSAVIPILENYAMLANSSRQQAVLLKGIDISWSSAKLLSDNMLMGDVSQLQPRLKMMKVIGIFEVGAQVDATTAYINQRDAQKFFQLGDNYQGLQLALDNPFLAHSVIDSIAPKLPKTMAIESWDQQMATLFQAMRMEKLVIGLLLSAIIAVAAFNIIACLVLMVADKRKDIAVLRTLGARSDQIIKIFIIQGSAIGIVGVVLGLVLGCIISLFIGDIVALVEQLTGSHIFDPAVFLINSLPSKLVFSDIMLVVVGASVISILSTLYPAWRAGQVLPAEALRYDQ
jgi:lipoprotein-releasing system permease protein